MAMPPFPAAALSTAADRDRERLERIRAASAAITRPPERATQPRPRMTLPAGPNGETMSVGVRPSQPPELPADAPAPTGRRPFGGSPSQPTPGDIIRGLGRQLGGAASQAMSAARQAFDPLNIPENAQPSPPPPPAPSIPDLNTPKPPSAAANFEQARQRAEGQRLDRWRENAAVTDEELADRAFEVEYDAFIAGSPGREEARTQEVLGGAFDRQRDADAIRTAEEKVGQYQAEMAAYVERRERAAEGDRTVVVGDPPPFPEFTAAEKGVLGISHDEEVGLSAYDTAEMDLTNDEKLLLEEAFVVNAGAEDYAPEDFKAWLSENFGDVDPEDRADAMRAAIRNIAPSQGPMTYDPTSVRAMDSQSDLSLNDPRQQGDLNYVDRDEYGNPIVNIPSARGRGARVNVEGATDTGGRGYARRTAGGDAMDGVTDGTLEVVGPNGRPLSEDEKAQFYSQSAGYDFEDMTPAERVGKSRKVYEDHKKRGRSFDTVFDDAAGENGEFRYTENDESKGRRQGRQAYGRVMRSIERDPRTWNDVFLNNDPNSPDYGTPDVNKIEAWVEQQGLFPETIDSEFGEAHDADVQRVKMEMVRRIASAMGRSEAWQQNLRMRGMEQNMRNPMLARQMLMGSIQEAEARGASPQEIARIYAAYGADGSARAEYALGAQQIQADAAVRAAEAGREPEEPPVGQQMRDLDIGVMQPYFDDPTDMNQYKNTLRYVESVIQGQARQNDLPVPDGDALASQATQSVAQVFLASPQGKNAMQFASANSAQGEFLRTPGIANYLTGFAEAAPERTWYEWLRGSDRTKKENFLNTVMANIGLSDDYRQALEMWFDDWAATVTGG